MRSILAIKWSSDNVAWSVVKEDDGIHQLVQNGVHTFPKGVKVDQTGESSRAAERREYSHARKSLFRRKLRKIRLINVLLKYGYCPSMPHAELKDWKYKKQYPTHEAFVSWTRINIKDKIDPYFFRNLAVTKSLNLKEDDDRFAIGRAFYHINQRRGYLSNRLDDKESDGQVMQNIKSLCEAKGDKTLGQYFYESMQKGEKIRGNYTGRLEHYEEEFKRICEFQKLPEDFVKEVYDVIFYQAPLKTKKQTIGRCPFESKKYRCATSNPINEEFRMWSFINNVRIKTPDDQSLRPLNNEEITTIWPLFFRKSKVLFDFEEICKKLVKKKKYQYANDQEIKEENTLFNYPLKSGIAGCPVSAYFMDIFGPDWKDIKIKYIRKRDGKESFYNINDIWHYLSTEQDDEKVADFAINQLGMNGDEIDALLRVKLPSGHAAISKNAMVKILPYLKERLNYSHAVFMANMKAVIPEPYINDPETMNKVSEDIKEIINLHTKQSRYIKIVNALIGYNKAKNYTWSIKAEKMYREDLWKRLEQHLPPNEFALADQINQKEIFEEVYHVFTRNMQANNSTGQFVVLESLDDQIKVYLIKRFGSKTRTQKLYHPSAGDLHNPLSSKTKREYLPDPKIIPINSPVFQRTSYQIKKIVNKLLVANIIDNDTIVQVIGNDDIRSSNERRAIKSLRKNEETKKKEITKIIEKYDNENQIFRVVSEYDIIRYQLWEEQNKICVYTGEEIPLENLLSTTPDYDIDFIIPLSKSFDRSLTNMVLASVAAINAKGDQLPYELGMKEALKERLTFMNKKIFFLQNEIQRFSKQSKMAATPDQKSFPIFKKHQAAIELKYFKTKYYRLLTDQLKPTHKYAINYEDHMNLDFAKKYLETTFKKVYTTSKQALSLFQDIWGVKERFTETLKYKYSGHVIDTMTATYINRNSFNDIEEYFIAQENGRKAEFHMPWATFFSSIEKMQNELIITNEMPVDLLKQNKRAVRKSNKLVRDGEGNVIYQESDTIRGSLHKDKLYGAIIIKETNKKGQIEEVLKYVVRKSIASMTLSDAAKIVNENVRNIVVEGKKNEPVIQKGIDSVVKDNKEIWRDIRALEKDKDEEADHTLAIEALKEQIDQNKKVIKGLEQDICNLYGYTNGDGEKILFKKAKVFTKISNPIALKPHMNPSKHKHKINKYVVNDANYKMAIYKSTEKNKKDEFTYEFMMLRNLDAAKRYKEIKRELGPDVNVKDHLFPGEIEKNGHRFIKQCELRNGICVLFYQHDPEEIWNLSKKEIKDRLYKVHGISNQVVQKKYHYGVVNFKHVDEKRSMSELTCLSDEWTPLKTIAAARRMSHKQFKGLIHNVDFKFDLDGNIIRL